MTNPTPNTDTSYQRFWIWFQENEEALFHLKSNDDDAFQSLAFELKRVHPNLVFEFGPVENNCHEFILSAGGIKEFFPVVKSLTEVATVLPRWKITAFRPRRTDIAEIQFGGVHISADNVLISYKQRGVFVNVILFLGDNRITENARGQIGFLFLDQALGEFDVATYIGHIQFKPMSSIKGMPAALCILSSRNLID